ncbi:MAG: hypothetical protein NC392_10470 [Roseburia sp.]|nr:hypothetical protein [Roseburia sp.]
MYRRHFKNFYMLIFIFWYSTEIIFNTTLDTIMGIPVNTLGNVINVLIFCALMVQIVVFQSYTKRELIIIIGITIPIVIATILSDSRPILSAWMFIVAAKNSDLDKIIHTAYKILLIMVPIVILLCLLGFIDDKILMRGSVERISLGFSHPNQLGLRIFQLMVCHCYVNKNKIGIANYLYIFFAIVFTISVPNSQTTYIALGILLFLLSFYRYFEKQKKIIMELYMKSLLIGACLFSFFSIIFSYINVNKYFILARINSWMSSRFSVCHRVWLIYGVSFWGQKIYVTEEERKLVGIKNALWLDNAYVSILLRYGVVVFLIFSIGYLCLIKNMILQKEYLLVIILFLYSVYGIMETGLYMITHNIFLIAFSYLLYNKTNTKVLNNEKKNL